MENYTTKDGDRLDLVCYEHYGHVNKSVEETLSQNPGLAEAGELLPVGIFITFPAVSVSQFKLIKLW